MVKRSKLTTKWCTYSGSNEKKTGFKILDVQFLNDHLLQFGAHEICKNEFQTNLQKAIQLEVDILSYGETDDDFSNCLSTFLQARIEMS